MLGFFHKKNDSEKKDLGKREDYISRVVQLDRKLKKILSSKPKRNRFFGLHNEATAPGLGVLFSNKQSRQLLNIVAEINEYENQLPYLESDVRILKTFRDVLEKELDDLRDPAKQLSEIHPKMFTLYTEGQQIIEKLKLIDSEDYLETRAKKALEVLLETEDETYETTILDLEELACQLDDQHHNERVKIQERGFEIATEYTQLQEKHVFLTNKFKSLKKEESELEEKFTAANFQWISTLASIPYIKELLKCKEGIVELSKRNEKNIHATENSTPINVM